MTPKDGFIVVCILIIGFLLYNTLSPKQELNQNIINAPTEHVSEKEADYFRQTEVIKRVQEYNGIWFTKWNFTKNGAYTLMGGNAYIYVTKCSPDFKEIELTSHKEYRDGAIEFAKIVGEAYPESKIHLLYGESNVDGTVY